MTRIVSSGLGVELQAGSMNWLKADIFEIVPRM